MQDKLAKIDTNKETHCKVLKEMQAKIRLDAESDRFFSLQNGGKHKSQLGRNESHN
jgi:hypothetical protein